MTIISKNILILYIGFCMLSTFLFLIGVFGIMPMAIGLTGFTFFFATTGVKILFSENVKKVAYALVFWSIIILLSIQTILLFNPDFKLMLLYTTTFILIISVVLIYRFDMDKKFYILFFLISQVTGLIYFNF